MADVAEQHHYFSFLAVLELLGLLNRQRGKGRKDRKESEVVVRERPRLFVQHVQHADRFSSPAPERYRDHVPRDEAGGLVNLVKIAGVLVDLVSNPGLPGLIDGAGNAFVPSNNRTAR